MRLGFANNIFPLCLGGQTENYPENNSNAKKVDFQMSFIGKRKELIVYKSKFSVFLMQKKIHSVSSNHIRPNLQNCDRRAGTRLQLQYMGVTISTNWIGGIDPESYFFCNQKL